MNGRRSRPKRDRRGRSTRPIVLALPRDGQPFMKVQRECSCCPSRIGGLFRASAEAPIGAPDSLRSGGCLRSISMVLATEVSGSRETLTNHPQNAERGWNNSCCA